jgi:hypothetical protein
MTTHALVKWYSKSDQILIDQVPITDISYDKNKGLIEDETYSVKYKSQKFKAVLKFIGMNQIEIFKSKKKL